MGASASKATKAASKVPSAAKAARTRKYPTRSPPASIQTRPAAQKDAEQSAKPFANTQKNKEPEEYAAPPTTSMNEDLVARMQSLGPVQPNPTQSNSSTFNQASSISALPSRDNEASSIDPQTSSSSFAPSASNPSQSIFPTQTQSQSMRQNPAISLLVARDRLAQEAEKEFASIGKRQGEKGRAFLDVIMLRNVLIMRDQGVSDGEIERRLGLRHGVVGRLGTKGVVGVGS